MDGKCLGILHSASTLSCRANYGMKTPADRCCYWSGIICDDTAAAACLLKLL